MNRASIFGILFLFVASIVAQEPLSFTQYRERVIAYSQILKQSKEQVQATMAGRKAAKTGYLPKIDFSANASLDLTALNAFNGPEGGYRNNTYSGMLQLNQPLFGGGAINSRYRTAGIVYEIARETERLSLDNIAYQADVAYWQVAAYEAFKNASQEFYNIVKEQEGIIAIRFKYGMISRTDLLMIQTRLKEAELQYSIAQKNYLIALHNFNILMGNTPDNDLVLIDSISSSDLSLSILPFVDVLNRRPDFKSSQLDVSLQEQNMKTAMSAYNPKLGLSVSGGWGTQQPNFGFRPEFSGLAAISLKIPVLYFGERKYVRQSNRATIRIKEWEISKVSDQILNQYSNAITNIKQSAEQIILARQNLAMAKENLQLATFSYNEGKTPIVDVLSAQLSWINAYSSQVTAYLNHKVSIADYQRISAVNSMP